MYEWPDILPLGDPELIEHRKFVWSVGVSPANWLLLMELDGLEGGMGVSPVIRRYTWGLDLDGLGGAGILPGGAGVSPAGLESAGGVGGLLAMEDPNDPNDPNDTFGSFVYLYDANGNVGQLIDWAHDPNDPNGAIVARYEYDPYGNVTAQSGSYAQTNPFRFSTKYWDDETGLGYWGRRYYNPALGRWLNRDPLDELGGLNLYAYVGNDPVDRFDPLGQMWCGREQGCYLENGQNEGGPRCPKPPPPVTETCQKGPSDPSDPDSSSGGDLSGNAQNCPATAPGTTPGDGWCKEGWNPLHIPPAGSCYRGYGQNANKQCCYTPSGCLIADGGPGAGTPDNPGPSDGENPNGSCHDDPWQWICHGVHDVAPYLIWRCLTWGGLTH